MVHITSEERFLTTLHKLGKSGVEVEKVAGELSMSSKKCKAIVRMLVRSNFIKKDGERVTLTQHGLNVIQNSLLFDK